MVFIKYRIKIVKIICEHCITNPINAMIFINQELSCIWLRQEASLKDPEVIVCLQWHVGLQSDS